MTWRFIPWARIDTIALTSPGAAIPDRPYPTVK